jgi:hypothetical protein
MIIKKEEGNTQVNDWKERAQWNFDVTSSCLVQRLMHAVVSSLTLPSFPPSRCQSGSLLPTGWASIVPCIAVLVSHIGICTRVATASWSNLELAVRVEDRLCKFTITAPQRLFYLGDSCFAPGYHHHTLHALSLPSIFIHDNEGLTKGPVICHLHCRRGTIRRRGRPWKKRSFSKRSSNGEGVFTWSVHLLVAVIDPHAFNSGDAYPLDPRKRNFIKNGTCRSVCQSLFRPPPLLRSRCRAEVDSGARSWKEQTATGREQSISEATELAND